MEKVAEKVDTGGKLQVMEDYDKHLFLARPHGIINPSLLAEDFKRAGEFSNKIDDHWTYCTNTEDVKQVNPLNILFLKEIKKLKKLKQIVIFAPVVRSPNLLCHSLSQTILGGTGILTCCPSPTTFVLGLGPD